MYLLKSNVVTRQRLMIIAYAPITQQRWFSPPNPDGSKQICKNPKIVFLFIITFDQMLTTINWYQRKMQTKVNSIEDEVKKKKPVITFSITTTSPTDQLNCLYLKALTSFYHRIIILYHITQYALFWFQQPSTINASPLLLMSNFITCPFLHRTQPGAGKYANHRFLELNLSFGVTGLLETDHQNFDIRVRNDNNSSDMAQTIGL